MKLLQINISLNTSSTGKIVCQISKMCIDNGDQSYIAFSGRYPENRDKANTFRIGFKLDFYWHALVTRIFDRHGFGSIRATKKLLKQIDYIKPDIGNFDINYLLASDYHFMKRILLSKFNGHKVNKVLSHFMKRDEALSSKYSFEMHSEVIQIKNDLGIVDRPVLDFFFNSYRKIYNFHTFFKKN